jgi:hypothetical protein
MIHGIYVKSKPNKKWHLVSTTLSPEAANYEVTERKKLAVQDGNEEAQVAIQIFDSAFWIPEYVDEIKERKALLN